MPDQHAYHFFSSKMSTQTVFYFLSTQDWRTEAPHEYLSVTEARRRKRKEGAYFVPGTNGIMLQSPRAQYSPPAGRNGDEAPAQRASEGWRVVDQTAKSGVRHKPTRIGPGCPRYALV
jgi:hypothetical protein